jgi:phenylpropionate dioxygenase-like ring-hydroxylating dioxygenase large terminal subunit
LVTRPDGSPPLFTTDRYTSAEFLEREKAELFRRCWIAIGRESDLPHAGDRLPVDAVDAALLLIRGDDGAVRVFHNTCRHRGTRLVTERCAGRRITCRYHGWTYALDGRLIGVPKSDGFEGLDKQTSGLLPVRSECWGGFVWATFSADAPPLREYLGEVAAQLEPYALEEMRPLYRRTRTLGCNWKAVLDQATESYHLRMVHGRSIGRVIDTVATFDGLGLHHRQTIPIADYPWRHRLDRWCVGDRAFTPDQMRLFHKYVIFPNTLVNVMPYHLTVFRVFPLGPDRCRFDYEFYVRATAGAIGRARGWLTLLASLYILREDLDILLPFQDGVRTAAPRPITFHREERPLAYFHAVVDRHLAGETGACDRGRAAVGSS